MTVAAVSDKRQSFGFDLFRLKMPRMFAALVLLALAGILLNYGLGALGQVILRRKGLA
jgi:ABC-type nitrate/sulfonate/bicarbonate transport system permease component